MNSMEWQQIKEFIAHLLSQPVPIICCSVGSLLVFVLVIISKTSIGKKALNTLRQWIIDFIAKVSAILTEIKNENEKLKQENEKLKIDLQIALNEKQDKIDKLEKLVEQIALNTHNVKSIECLRTYKEEKESGNNGREEN